ncbi:MAG: ubiquinone/menaquinone biosynthesis methyltransferase [Ignavibacteria bacterium]|nr:ubiquinone/menaquinone biosynthesis methyltransferase [Ignavibacteria bacterium]
MNKDLDKSKDKIASMFDDIAPAYDKLNHLFTLNIDMIWRRDIIKNISNKNYKVDKILDLASGTGDLTKELLNLNPDKIIAADISSKMLEILNLKIQDDRLINIQAEAQSLPFENNYFDIVTIGFGVRNFDNLEKSLSEIKRVMQPDGKLIILEMFKGDGLKTKLFNVYFGKLMPLIGNKISKSKAYSYLYKSVDSFYSLEKCIEICNKCGFKVEMSVNNLLGIVNTLYLSKVVS